MKNTIILTAIAVLFSVTSVSANAMSLETMASENTSFSMKANSFCVAILKGDLETVTKMVEYGEDVNQVSNGMTPLMYAAKYNRADIVKFLISKGAKVNAKSDKGLTAMKYAESTNAEEVIKVLQEMS